MELEAWKQEFFSDKMPACPQRGHWVSFCLVDETGNGKNYGGLPYSFHDSAGQQYSGRLNGEGFAKIMDFCCGPVVLTLDEPYTGTEAPYHRLATRLTYKLPITELQVRAERSEFSTGDGQRLEGNPARRQADRFYQVEVRDLVRHVAHLPPLAPRSHGPQPHALKKKKKI